MGFGVPLARWFRGELRELPTDVLLDPRSLARGYFRRDEIECLIREHRDARCRPLNAALDTLAARDVAPRGGRGTTVSPYADRGKRACRMKACARGTGVGFAGPKEAFEFGRNWQRYLEKYLDSDRVAIATRSLHDRTGEDLTGKVFLDPGAGSGLFSLCADLTGAGPRNYGNNQFVSGALSRTDHGKLRGECVRDARVALCAEERMRESFSAPGAKSEIEGAENQESRIAIR